MAAIDFGPHFRRELDEFPQSLDGQPALLLEEPQLQLALQQDLHDFVIIPNTLLHWPPCSQEVAHSNIRAFRRCRAYWRCRDAPTPRQMPRYCIVVKSANQGLFRALEEAFLGRAQFSVVKERRRNRPAESRPVERRTARVWETGELQFSESPDE